MISDHWIHVTPMSVAWLPFNHALLHSLSVTIFSLWQSARLSLTPTVFLCTWATQLRTSVIYGQRRIKNQEPTKILPQAKFFWWFCCKKTLNKPKHIQSIRLEFYEMSPYASIQYFGNTHLKIKLTKTIKNFNRDATFTAVLIKKCWTEQIPVRSQWHIRGALNYQSVFDRLGNRYAIISQRQQVSQIWKGRSVGNYLAN